MRRTWAQRGGASALLVLVLLAAATVLDFEPDPVQVALIAVLAVAVGSLLVDATPDRPPAWRAAEPEPVRPPGQDARTTSYLRVLEAHRTAREPGPAVRDRLATLAEQALRARHGLGRDDPAARHLLGTDLLAVIDGPVRRLSHREIDRCLRRIEDL